MSRDELEETILETLADEGPSYVVDLAAVIDEHPVAVDHACERLHDEDATRSIGCRRYDITAAGYRRLDDVRPATGGSDGRAGTERRT
ncbi:MarR family transcriptional regulator [Natrinema sp. SYSU A 869]|uniref:MarR family transcriptional regulator n=1 Tax=Natrinema sp. SYSU A 869 TaxID=2871694 RepID=UPI001CA425EA|nr:MarR family transcriptional regulator [Natrinema sp. SYSU A 869]